MLHRVIIKEVVTKVEYIEASDKYGALKEAQRMYNNGEIDMTDEMEVECEFTHIGTVETDNQQLNN